MAVSTDEAKVYRRAAEHVAEHHPIGSCCAVYAVQHGGVDGFDCWKLDQDRLTSSYIRTMSASATDSSAFTDDMHRAYRSREKRLEHRLLSLLFMAAMVEAGDA
jgi:hypothetical protein